jgi:Sulfotransferase family
MTSAPPLPAFVIIGAAKSATTWLRNQLAARNEVFLPRFEPHHFSREHERGEAWYREWFAGAAAGHLVGEKSADYLADAAVPQRMHRLLPEAKLIVQLRNPVERAYSDYCMFFRRGSVGKDIRAYLDPARSSLVPRFLADGAYCAHLERFLEFYSGSRLKVLIYDDIADRPQAVVREVEQFLELAAPASPLPLVASANVKDAPLLPLPLRRALAPAKGWVAPLRSQPWFKAIRGTLAREIEYPALPEDLRQALCDHYAQDVASLERLIGRDLGHWLAATPKEGSRNVRAA